MEFRNLTTDETYQLAALRTHGGYQIIRSLLQAAVDTLGDNIENQDTDEAERRLVAEWRAARRILKLIDFHVENASNEVTNLRQLAEQSDGTIDPNGPAATLAALHRQNTVQSMLRNLSFGNLEMGDTDGQS